MPKISIIIPVKELNDNLFETICNYRLQIRCKYEIIIIYDIKSNSCYEKFVTNFNNDDSIKLLLNPYKGRINALNHGYSHSKGSIIKCIDADDIILNDYFDKLSIMDKYPAHCHNALLINENNSTVGAYTFEISILLKDYNYVLSNLKSPPRWIWSFKREIAEYIFPIPPELFAEDIWFSLIIKKNCDKIYHLNSNVYLYRQHDGGEWGGIKNFSSEVMARRAKWVLKLIPVLLNNKNKLGIVSDDIFANLINYYNVFLSKKSLSAIFHANTTTFYKFKLFVAMYFPKLTSTIIQYKWNLSKIYISCINCLNIQSK